jgi:DNA polymerase III alpha subunit (gram-positive type)
MIKNDFLRNLPNQLYVVWDTETEGLNLVRSRPWQISYALFKGTQRIDLVDKFIRWDDINVSKEAADVTGFNLEKYKDLAEDPKKVFSDFGEYLFDESIINVGHNILGFDIYMDKVARRLSGASHTWAYLKNSIDTLALAKGSKGSHKPDFENFLAWQFAMLKAKGRGNKLVDLAKELGVEVDEKRLHDSSYDIEINYQVFQKYIQIYAI